MRTFNGYIILVSLTSISRSPLDFALENIYIFRPNLIDYTKSAKAWTMKQMDGNALTVEKKGWKRGKGGKSVFL